jgi:hypothetical protein
MNLTEITPQSLRPASVGAEGDRSASLTYFWLCLSFAIMILVARIVQNRLEASASLYCMVLFAICVGPALLGRRNPRHRIISMFMGCYFLIFGLDATVRAVTGEATLSLWGSNETTTGVGPDYALTSDVVVILGSLALLAGYFFVHKLRGSKSSTFLGHEWRYGSVLKIGALTWAIGFAVMIAYDMNVSPMLIPTHVLGLPLGIASNIRLLSPIGAMMLIYLVARGYRQRLVWTLLLTVIAAEFLFGFVSNSKEISFQIPVLLFVGLYYLYGRVSKKVLIMMLVVAVPYLLFFNAYRMIMGEQEYRTPGAAFEAFGKNIAAVKQRTEGQAGVVSGSLESLTQRVDGKVYVDIIVAGIDSGHVRRLGGTSIGWFFESFIPRFLWPEKPDISIGQLFNHEFNLSESRFTFVPTTQLGELYWNFGMLGAIVGMLFIGLIFGQLSGALLDRSGMTMPRFMMLLMSTYYLVVRFESNIAVQYSTFVRLVILIWLVDRLLRFFGVSRSVRPASESPSAEAPTETTRMRSVPG